MPPCHRGGTHKPSLIHVALPVDIANNAAFSESVSPGEDRINLLLIAMTHLA